MDLVATVGLNPIPVAHAALTRHADTPLTRVVLVHTTRTHDHAVRLETFLRTRLTADAAAQVDDLPQDEGLAQDGASPPVPEVVLLDVGAGVDLGDTTTNLAEGLKDRGVQDTYMLDYTGGNKVLTVCAVAAHVDSGSPHHLRSYVDDTTRTLRLSEAQGAAGRLWIKLGPQITLVERAQLNGFTFTVRTDVLALGVPDVGVAAADLVKAINLKPQIQPDDYETWDYAWPEIIQAGDMLEWACCLSMAAAVTGLDDVEVLHGVRAFDDREEDLVAEFDVLIRVGHVVLAVEVKSNAKDARATLGVRAGHDRLVFGSAVRSMMVTAQGNGNPRAIGFVTFDDVGTYLDTLRGNVPWLGNLSTAQLDTRQDVDDLAAMVNDAVKQADTPAPGNRVHAHPGANDAYSVLPSDGSRLAVDACRHVLASWLPTAKPLAMGSGAANKEQRKPRRTVDARSESHLLQVLQGLNIAGAAVTPGPKPFTAALVRRSLAGGFPLAHLAVDGRVQWFPSPPVNAPEELSEFQPAWVEVFKEAYWQVDGVDLGQPPEVVALVEAGARMVKPRGGDAAPLAPLRSPLVLASKTGQRCSAVFQMPGGLDQPGWKNSLQLARLQFLDVTSYAGDAHRPLLILPAEYLPLSRRRMLGRLVESENWLPLAFRAGDAPAEVDDEVYRHLGIGPPLAVFDVV